MAEQQQHVEQQQALQQSRGQLQVIPSMPNNGPYLQYAPGQIIMPSTNFAVQAATPHMFTAQGKQVIAAQGTPNSFSPQTIFISNLPNIMSSQPTFVAPNTVYFRDQPQPKLAVARSILPSSPTIRAGSSVSTQTATGVQMAQIIKPQKPTRPKRIVQSPAQQTTPITTTTAQPVPQQMLFMHPQMLQQRQQLQVQQQQAQQQQQQILVQYQQLQQQQQQIVPVQQQAQQQQAPQQPQPQVQQQIQQQPMQQVQQQTQLQVQQQPMPQQLQQQQAQQQQVQQPPQPQVQPPAHQQPQQIQQPETQQLQQLQPDDLIKDKALPRALVKPHVLTHVINGHVIQEAGEPFPVHTSSQTLKTEKDMKTEESPSPAKKIKLDQDTASESLPNGVAEMEHNNSTDHISLDPSLSKTDPAKWTVADVYKFIKDLPGCSDYAEEFENQEIDGQALMLLKEDHLMSAMAMKLGPALKIVAQIDSMREEIPASKPDN